MLVCYFIMYVVISGLAGILYWSYVMDENHTSETITKKRATLNKLREDVVSRVYVYCGTDKDTIYDEFDKYIIPTLFWFSWLKPILLLRRLIKGVFIHGQK